MSSADVNVPFFKKKARGRPTTSRKRSASPPTSTFATSSNPSSSKSEVVLPTKKAATNLLSAGSKRTASQRQDELDEDDDSRKEGLNVKWAAEGSHISAALEILEGDEAEEMLAKKQKKIDPDDMDVPDDGLYRGQKAYKSHIQKNKDIPKSMRVGPQRVSGSTIRTVTITDYQPDVCKDYKETGYCGFGDTCKFLHDRGTYLAGWQLDRLAEAPQRQVEDVPETDSDEDMPFACLICRKPYTDPVVTRCGHYFDSACAIKRFAKTPKCAACGAPTGGIFNRADKILERIKKQKEKAEAGGENDEESTSKGGVQIEGLEQDSNAPSENEDSEEEED